MSSIAEKIRLSEPTTKIWMKIDQYCQWQKCRSRLTPVSGRVRIMRIFSEVLWGGASNESGVMENDFRAFGRYVFGTLGNETNIIMYYYLVFVTFPVTPKYMTLNYPDWLFRVKFCFRAGLAGWDRATSENNCVKTNKDRHILSAVQISGMDSSFWHYTACACGYSFGFSRKETLKDSGVAAPRFLAFENYCVKVNTDRPII